MTYDQMPHRGQLDDEACAWVERFAIGKGSRAEMSLLKEWMARSPAHAEAFERVSRTWSSLDAVGSTLATKGVIARRGGRIWSGAGDRRIGRRAFIGGGVAAAAAGVAVAVVRPPLDLWPSWQELTADVRTRPGEQRQLALDPRLSIDLNTRTSVALSNAGMDVRLITGEIVVSSSAQSDASFVLTAMAGRVVADHATRLNVRIDDQSVFATCLAGSVRVEQGAKAVPLGAGQQVMYSATGIGPAVAIDVSLVTAWRDGIVVFDAAPISNVIAEVNRYLPGRIILTNDELGRRLFSARLKIENVGHVVRQIELAFGARVRQLPGGITLIG